MPVDFSQFPPMADPLGAPPSRVFWAAVFVLLTLAGVLAVLVFWPKDEPTHTPWFWISLTVYPLGLAAFVVLRRYGVYEGRRLDAIAWNDAREGHVQKVLEVASRPLGVMASSYCLSADMEENQIGALVSNTLLLKTRLMSAPDAAPRKARWLAALDLVPHGCRATDVERQRLVLPWLFERLLDDVEDAVCALPRHLRLRVQLDLSVAIPSGDAAKVWEACWKARGLRAPTSSEVLSASDLMILDTWLDGADRREHREARLLISVQLHPVLEEAPPSGSAEVGVAFLWVPADVARHHAITCVANVCRPMQGSRETLDHALAYALTWARSAAADVRRLWWTGCDPLVTGAARKAFIKAGIDAPSTDIDGTAGHAGVAAPWLALACAIAAARAASNTQLVVVGQGDGMQLAAVTAAT
jgi:hypothetical protein